MGENSGDIGLVSIPGGVGWLIRAGQWLNGDGFGTYEHAFVRTGEDTVVQAQPGGAAEVPLDQYSGVLWLRCPEEDRQAVADAARVLVGTPYSFADYAAIALHRFHVGWLTRRYVKNTGHMICSQLADEAARRGGWHLFSDGRLAQDVTPGDLARLARASL